MQIGEFNALPLEAAVALVSGCLGVDRWVDDVVSGRPYDNRTTMLSSAAAAAQLTDAELASALTHHPRIGERPTSDREDEARFSRSEQSGVRREHADVLRAANTAYEERFGRVFLIRAAGRGSDEILAELERRLGNDPAAEREETVRALRDIAVLRLGRLVLS